MSELVLTTNGKLSSETLDALKNKLASRFGCDSIRLETDENIIGGFTVKYDGTFYDATVASRLGELKRFVMTTEADR